jgi:hypothetical protein
MRQLFLDFYDYFRKGVFLKFDWFIPYLGLCAQKNGPPER